MPATIKHLDINFNRIQDNSPKAIRELAAKALKENRDDLQKAWKQLVTKADEAHIADKLPGTVGRQFAVQYGTVQKRRVRKPKDGKLFVGVAFDALNFADVRSAAVKANINAGGKKEAIVARLVENGLMDVPDGFVAPHAVNA